MLNGNKVYIVVNHPVIRMDTANTIASSKGSIQQLSYHNDFSEPGLISKKTFLEINHYFFNGET